MTNTTTPATTPVDKGWFETIKEKLNLDTLTKKFDLSKDKIITLVFYLGAGFLAGFLIKRFFKYVLVLAAIVVAIYFLEKSGVVHVMVDWTRMNEVFGIKSIPQVDGNLFWVYWQWIKANLAVSISFLIGFIVGWKVS
ncbi:FUN14 domain-containing protein [Candidatus Dependentiae bacterium]